MEEENFSQEIYKEFYKSQLESAGKNLIERSDELLEDWDKGIANIHIEIDVNPNQIATLKVTKEYNPRRVQDASSN